MEENVFSIRYEGEGISEGLEPTAFAEALRGFAEFITTVTETLYGTSEGTTLKIHRLSQGSLLLEMLQRLGEVTVNDMLAATVSISAEINHAIELLKHLRGQPPKSVDIAPDNRVAVQNNNGNIAFFSHSTVHMVVSGDLGGSIERFTKPVTEGQASGFAIEVNSEPATQVSRADAESMVSVAADKELLESESEIWLTATKVVLQGDAKWTFSDGRRPITAPVMDPNFLERVGTGHQRFGNGDRLLVRLKTKQFQRGTRLRTQYEVTQVLKHERQPADGQASLFER